MLFSFGKIIYNNMESKVIQMNETPATLYLELYLIGLESKVVIFEYPLKTLGEIDALTMKYQNKQDFFDDQKEPILRRLNRQKQKYGITIDPIDIELSDIYLKKQEKRIAILFQKLKSNNQEFEILELIKRKLFHGKIFTLYEADKLNQQNANYETLFDDSPKEFLENLEISVFKSRDLTIFWEQLIRKKRFPAVIRFIMSNPSKPEDIPLRENLAERVKNENIHSRERIYYTPYKDD